MSPVQSPRSKNPMLPETGWREPAPSAFRMPDALDEGAMDSLNPAETRALERLRRWATSSPEPWEELSAEEQEDLIHLRVPLSKRGVDGAPTVKWGALGHLGFQVSPMGSTPTVSSYKRKLEWGDLARVVPSSLIEHESVPGVSDGWILLAKLCSQEKYGADENDRNMINLWSNRLLKAVPEEERNRMWRVCMLKAAGVLLDEGGMGVEPKGYEVFVARLLSSVLCTSAWYGGLVSGLMQPELRRELSALMVSTRSLRSIVVSDQGNVEIMLLDGLEIPWTVGVTPATLWAGVLDLYHTVCRKAASGAQGSFGSGRSFLEKTMRGWVDRGFLPSVLQEDQVQGGLVLLATHQPDIHRTLMLVQSTHMANRLEACLEEVPSRPRTRM